MNTITLKIYLNDHLAGSVTALELLEHLIGVYAKSKWEARFRTLKDEIGADQNALKELIKILGVEEGSMKKAAGWLAEKATAVKFVMGGAKQNSFGLFQSLEMLSLGVEGKRSLWRSLMAAGIRFPETTIDLPELRRRAVSQRQRIEKWRLDQAAAALG